MSDTPWTDSKYVWFACWRCDCTDLELSQYSIPDKCPTHGRSLYARPEPVENTNNVPLGIKQAIC